MKDPGFAKFVLLVNGSVPLALLCWDAVHHDLGANPINFALHTTGTLALIFLLLSLTITPVRKISDWNWLSHFRRSLGLFAFFYGVLHLLIYFRYDQSLSISAVLKDIKVRWFILLGMTSLLLMLPLAITSTNGMIKRLGGKNWKLLHKLVYPAAIAAVLHYFLLVKKDTTKPLAFAAVLAILLGYRLVARHIPSLKRPALRTTALQ